MWLLVNNIRTKFSDKLLTVCFYFALRLQESDWSKHVSSCLYFVACFCFWHYPLNFELRWCCSQQTCLFFVTVFQGSCNQFLISTFCTNSVFLHSKKFNFLLCLRFINNQNAAFFVWILLLIKLTITKLFPPLFIRIVMTSSTEITIIIIVYVLLSLSLLWLFILQL